MSNVIELRRKLDELFPNRYELDVGANKTAIILVIDALFAGQTYSERLKPIEALLHEAGLQLGITDLYTPDEAKELGIEIAQSQLHSPATWEEAISMVDSGKACRPNEASQGKRLRRIVFYSYKGGVGRTTALVHTAFHLARSGLRVVVADMDVEAPGLHAVLPRPDGKPIVAGLVDYLWERQVRPVDLTEPSMETCLVEVKKGQSNPISYEVEDPVSHAQIHVIPAGIVNSNFVRRLHSLSYHDVLTRADDAWSLFEKELVEQIDPDILLIDARTGLGDWGGLSLLRLADEAFLVLYPSDQNIEGLHFVRKTLRDTTGINSHLVLSPIPEGLVGRDLIERFRPSLELEEDEVFVEIYYNPSIASAQSYPVESAMSSYARLANFIRETEVENKLEVTLKNSDRWSIIESLNFPERDANAITSSNFDDFFQKTSDFDKFLDDARWVVRGRKGTGKSTLFHLFVDHTDKAIKSAKGKLENIMILAGHGPAKGVGFRPTTDEFGAIQRLLVEKGYDWLSLWRAYAIVRIFTSTKEDVLTSNLKKVEMKKLKAHLEKNFRAEASGNDNSKVDRWRSKHTNALLELLHDPFNGLCRDLMDDMNHTLAIQGKKLWLLYDDLDQDIKEDSPWQGDALGGLLRLAYDANNSDIHNIRFKVFLREDIWNKLVFTNKSHFGDPRTLLLQWRIEDFLRLAYRLATGGSKKFLAFASQSFPLPEIEIDSATEAQLRQALAPLWGLNQEKGKNAFVARWVYSRLTDAVDNTYPRSLTVLLRKAMDHELEGKGEVKPIASDRLLSRPALQAGLIEASIERVNALKNEYPNLKQFLENIQNTNSLPSQFKSDELRIVWQSTSHTYYPTFESFIAQLEGSGLLMKKNGKTYDYGFAPLYIDGLGGKRVMGEKK